MVRFKMNLGEIMNNKSIAVELVFGVGIAWALNNWIVRIMFGTIYYTT